jgi:hypothetical protein
MAEVRSHGNPLLERGDIYFLYRPEVDKDAVHGPEDVSRVYLVLKPSGTARWRLVIVGRKRLPDPAEHDRFWAFVWRVFTDRAALGEELAESTYETRTRGTRKLPSARPVAEGIYAIVRHGDHTHLAYLIELPKRRGPAERELNIRREASYIVAVRNPETPRPPTAGRGFGRPASFPPELQERFAGRRFIPLDPPAFLDHAGAELVLIGAAANPERELGLEFTPDDEDEHTADVLRDLQLPREIAREPLFEGRWK